VKLYVTYGYNSNLRNNFSEVEGETLEECYRQINDTTRGQYAFTYDEFGFAGQVERYGLTEVPLQPQTKRD